MSRPKRSKVFWNNPSDSASQLRSRLRAYCSQIATRRMANYVLRIGEHIAMPPTAINLLKDEWLDSVEELMNGNLGKGYEVWITPHEAHVIAIHHDLNGISC